MQYVFLCMQIDKYIFYIILHELLTTMIEIGEILENN